MTATRRQFIRSAAPPLAFAATAGVVTAATPALVRHAIRRSIAELDARRRAMEAARAEAGRLEESGADMEIVWAQWDGPVMSATRAFMAARDRLDGATRGAGFRGVFSGGLLYLALSDEEHQDDEHLGGVRRSLILDLDAIGGAA